MSTKKITIVAAVAFLLPVVLVAAVVGGIAGLFGDSSRTDCAAVGSTTTGVAGYDPDQMANAATIVAVGKQMIVPTRGWVIAIATAMQESGLRNLDYGDRDSLGLFQQRPSQGWGTPAQIMNPTYSATQFYQHLLAVPGWQAMSLTNAAQTVQRSGFPDAYARHEHAARIIVAAVHNATCSATAGEWTVPALGRCSSGFGPREGGFHHGLDIAAPLGTAIVAAGDGLVIDAGPASGYGLWIRIQHRGGTITTYGHNNRNLVHKGQAVAAGQPIAEVGNRGQSTGPHLHFQIEVGGEAIDPVTFYRQNGIELCS
ncbi:Peptidase family M23 [Lentzea albidocapillata subsp. violacea]|uniref:Peptidase family M23 n=1 Tax=Lentzea albidocapillata subsp. violacea TaxID=128104 RepID=A0A1G9XQK7_9PSEU|nr:M23 family metallopeptidase [Lentzea albidocapillata]SDM99000.1 Peptidase family M23 [Lentzea albidocapillata subsp. violacea]